MESFQFERAHMAGADTEKITYFFIAGRGKGWHSLARVKYQSTWSNSFSDSEGSADDDQVRVFGTTLG
jgi:hypothetical protein